MCEWMSECIDDGRRQHGRGSGSGERERFQLAESLKSH